MSESSSVLQKKRAADRLGAPSHHAADFSLALPTLGMASRAGTKRTSRCSSASAANLACISRDGGAPKYESPKTYSVATCGPWPGTRPSPRRPPDWREKRRSRLRCSKFGGYEITPSRTYGEPPDSSRRGTPLSVALVSSSSSESESPPMN
eukprot:scaffold32225_cov112-Isochrysis_galbana.AAC.1